MKELSIVPDGALLIHNGVIQESGPSRRVENLAQSRKAREIDASGTIVMPAFVDADAVLVVPPPSTRRTDDAPKAGNLRVFSRRRLEIDAFEAAADRVRAGILTIGAHTGYAADLRDSVKVLRIHHSLQTRPLRIRSILSPRLGPVSGEPGSARSREGMLSNLAGTCLPCIRARNLAGIVELVGGNSAEGAREQDLTATELRNIAMTAAGLGYSIRVRSWGPPGPDLLDLAAEAGAISMIAPPDTQFHRFGAMAEMGCVHVLPATAALPEEQKVSVRDALDEGAAIALGSSYVSSHASGAVESLNPQFLLHLACERFGLTSEEAIVATTYNAACSLRMSHVIGSLEPGKYADLLFMDVPDYRDLARRVGHNDVQLAMRGGKPVYRRASLIVD